MCEGTRRDRPPRQGEEQPLLPIALSGGAWGWGLPRSSRRRSPQMIQTSRTLIESADAVYGKLTQAQQAGGCWGDKSIPGAALCHRPRGPGMSPRGLGPAGCWGGKGKVLGGWAAGRERREGRGAEEADEEAGKSH